MRLWIAGFSLSAAVLLVTGCGSTGSPQEPPARPEAAKKSGLTRFTFKDVESNSETGGRLPERDVQLIGASGETVSLSDYRGKPLVLIFMRGFPGFICPYCTTQTAQLAARYGELTAAGAEVAIVYPTKEDDREKVREFVAACNEILEEEGEAGLPFPVLLDPGTKVVRRYNIEGDLSKPSTYVLDAQGVVHYAYVGRTSDDRPSVDRILKEVQSSSAE